MCLFTHFAAGALAGGLTGNVWAGAAAGMASHAVLDAIPHYDHPDWRLELAAGVISLILLLLMPFATLAAVVGGIFGMVPDLENLFQKLGKMRRDQFIFPSHTGLIPHGRTLGPRSLVWQLAIFVFCFGLLGLISPEAAKAAQVTDAQPVMGDPVVRLLSSSTSLTRIQVDYPVVVHPDDWSQVHLDNVEWGIPMTYSQDDAMEVTLLPPSIGLNIAVPTAGDVNTLVSALSWWKEPTTAVDPSEMASFARPAIFREVPITGCTVPLSLGEGILRSLVIEIQHSSSNRFSKQLRASSGDDSADKNSAFLDKAPAGILNPSLFNQLSSGGRKLLVAEKSGADKGQFNAFDLTGNWVRLSIDENGLHRLTGQELSSMGVSTGDVDPEKIRIYRGGGIHLDENPEIPESEQPERVGLQEVAIQLLDGQDGEWNLDDEIRFYAFGTDFWTDRADGNAGHLEHYNHPFENEGVYWLTWENMSTPSPMEGSALRVEEVNTPANAGTDLSMAKMRQHNERQTYEGFGHFQDDWLWDDSIYYTKTLTFETFSPVPDSAATFVVDYRGDAHGQGPTVLDYDFMSRTWVNDDTAHAQDALVINIAQEDSLRVRTVGSSSTILSGANVLSFSSTNPDRSWPIALDSFDIFYWAYLDLVSFGGQLEFATWRETVEAEGQQVNLRIAIPSGENIIMWEVGDPRSSRVLNGDLSPNQLTCGLTLSTAADRHFLVTTEDDLHQVASGKLDSPIDLRSQPTDAHYVVVYAPEFSAPARNLADFRSSYLPEISNPKATSVSAQDIYDNFSGGQKDVRAIRNYLKFLYESGGGNLRYVCLLGNGTKDHRNYLNQNPNSDLVDLLPAHHRTHFPINVNRAYSAESYGTDDTVVSFDHVTSYDDVDFPDVAIGRLPAVSLAEANSLVERMIQYSSSVEPGLWGNRFLMVADDCVKPTLEFWPQPSAGEHSHTLQAKRIFNRYLPPSLDVVKIYGVNYDFPPGSNIKPQVQQDINAILNEGTTIFHYVGHGDQNNLADEQYFKTEDIPNLTNGMKRGIFVAFSCDVGIYDSPARRSMAEMFLLPSGGGAIGSICASQVSYISENNHLSEYFYANLFPEMETLDNQTISETLLLAKGSMANARQRHNSQKYNLLSDPAMSLPHPVNDLAFAATSVDTLRAGAREVAVLEDRSGLMLGAGDIYSLRVEESAYDAGYIYTYTDSSSIRVPRWATYVQSGSTVFEGYGNMESNELRVPFKVPVQLRYGDKARLRMILSNMDGNHVANTAVSAVRQALGPNDDFVGPQITMAFEDNRHQVKPGTQLTATLQDTSSIAILGTTPGNSLLLEFDDSGFMTDITPSFNFDANSYTQGRISFPLPGDLPLGSHQAAIHASDVLGNVGNDTISFVIVADNVVGMDSITLFPNPTPGPCRLIFELSDAMLVKWEIYTLSGRRIKSMQETLSAGPQLMPWDGRDDQGDEIANGTYLYVLRGTVAGAGERDITETGKLVIMR